MATVNPMRHILCAKVTHEGRIFFKASFVQTEQLSPAPKIDTWHLAATFCNQWDASLRRETTWNDNAYAARDGALNALMQTYAAIPKEDRRSGIAVHHIHIAVDTASQSIELWDGT